MNIRLFSYLISIVALGTLLSCQPTNTSSETDTTTETGPGNIVFIRVDSLTAQYTSLSEKTDALEARAMEADKSQNERISAFQRDVQNFQQRAPNMAPKNAGIEQERLAGREQALMQQAEQLRQELQLEQMRLSAEFEENLMKILDEIQSEKTYDYILSYGNGTGVLIANDRHDITAEVVKRLNKVPMDGKMDAEIDAEDLTDDDTTEQ